MVAVNLMSSSNRIDTSNRFTKIPNKLITDDGRELKIIGWDTSSVMGEVDKVYIEAIPVLIEGVGGINHEESQ